MREVSRHLFIPRRPLIASMLASDPERSWIRIVKASLISSTRGSLTSVSAPFPMTRRLPLPAECLINDLETLLTYLDFPADHWDHLRTTNPIERVFATVRHRTVRMNWRYVGAHLNQSSARKRFAPVLE
jgi:transposase-like protein